MVSHHKAWRTRFYLAAVFLRSAVISVDFPPFTFNTRFQYYFHMSTSTCTTCQSALWRSSKLWGLSFRKKTTNSKRPRIKKILSSADKALESLYTLSRRLWTQSRRHSRPGSRALPALEMKNGIAYVRALTPAAECSSQWLTPRYFYTRTNIKCYT